MDCLFQAFFAGGNCAGFGLVCNWGKRRRPGSFRESAFAHGAGIPLPFPKAATADALQRRD
ncbi:MAG: hypothetical protein PHH77_09270 [Victivallaceae bacterium]|nr:hypothetical protein [Victivallaceae bacterium]